MTQPFFKDRGIKDQALGDLLNLMTLQEFKQDQFVVEYGQEGEEFFLILEGEVEILLTHKYQDEYNQICRLMRAQVMQVEKAYDEVHQYDNQSESLIKQKEEQDKFNRQYTLVSKDTNRRFTQLIDTNIPESIQERFLSAIDKIEAVNRYSWRKKYELLVPGMILGHGRSFGELAVQKSVNNKIKATRTRQATVLCRTDCKFAVLT